MRVSAWVILLLLGLPGCRDAAFQAASRRDTAEAYRDFIRSHPMDPDTDAAVARLAELTFEEARRTHTVVAYKRFLEEFPDSAHARDATALLETLRFTAAMAERTPAALTQFLKDHPSGAHRDEAEEALHEAQLDALDRAPGADEVRRALLVSPQDARVEAAQGQLDDQAFAAATTARALLGYLEAFPAGRHRDGARVRLLSLKLDSLLAAGDLDAARQLLDTEPLAGRLTDGKARVEAASAERATVERAGDGLARALPGYTLRPVDELVRSLSAPDPLDRWQAAEELGFVVSPTVLGPLLDAAVDARLELTRARALRSLFQVVRALPAPVAEYELTTRLAALAPRASDPRRVLAVAVLLDLVGDARAAAAEYRRAFDSRSPDAVILRRWAEIRLAGKEPSSAGVAARQLALHAMDALEEAPSVEQANPRAAARTLCSLAEQVRAAAALLDQVAAARPDFPEDVATAVAQTRANQKVVEARLRDAELALLRVQPDARLCADDGVTERMAAGERQRLEVLTRLKGPLSPEAQVVVGVARTRDPSFAVREAAARL